MIFFRSVISIVKIAGVMKFEFQRNLEIRLSITGIFYPVCNYDFLLNKIAQEVNRFICFKCHVSSSEVFPDLCIYISST